MIKTETPSQSNQSSLSGLEARRTARLKPRFPVYAASNASMA